MTTELTPALEIIRGPVDGADCANCPFARDDVPNHPVVGEGIVQPLFVAVGEGPGRVEGQTGRPFVGPTGQLLMQAFAETGVTREQVYLTNATLCQPFPKATDKDKHAAAAACRTRLERELMDFPDRPVLLLGGVAAKALLEPVTKLPITEIAGTHFTVDVDGAGPRSLIPTIHPSAILRASDGGSDGKGSEKTGSHTTDLGFWSLKWDILKVKALGQGRDIHLRMRLGQEVEIELTDPTRARRLVRERLTEARASGRLTIDYETYVDDPQRNTALQAFVAKIRLIGLASAGKACSVLWDMLDAVTVADYAAALADETITKEYHNATYDTAVSQNQWYRFVHRGPIECTLLGQHAAWPGAKKKLQHVVSQYFAVEPWKSEFRDAGDTLTDEAIYNAKDVLGTHAAVVPTKQWIKRTKTERVNEIDKMKAHAAVGMHLHGYYVDPDVNAEIVRRLKENIDEANAMMYAAYDQIRDRTHRILAAEKAKTARKGDVNEDGTPLAYSERVKVRLEELLREIDKGKFVWKPSNDGHATAFLKASGVPLWQTTKKGKTASGAAVLEAFANHAVVDELLRMRGNEALYDMNVRMFQWVQASDGKWKPPFVQDDGRVHPIWSPTQISGRSGSVNPASSNWTMGNETHADPKKRLPNIRRQLVAPPGRAIVAFDMEQLEARLIAVQSGDPFLCQIFADGLDIHHEFGVLVFPEMAAIKAADPKGFKGNEQYNMYRDLTKRFEYGAIYGGSDATVHKAVSADAPHITLKMTSQAIIKMKSRISHVFAWQQRLLAKTSQPPYTLWSYLLGRRRVFPMGKPPATDVANNPNQFAGADIMDIGYSRLVPRLEKYKGTAFLILNQHDADYFECDEADVPSLARDIQESFTQEVEAVNGQKILFPCDLKAGYSYAVEPSDKQKEKHPYLVWPVGRPGLKKVKV